MKSLRIIVPVVLSSVALEIRAVADEGMWLLNHPPTKMLKDKYGFEPSADWLEHVQKSCVRFETGGSGSIVSADGLVMTNHHVGADDLEKLSTPTKNLLETGFYAKTRAEEAKCPDLELRLLWSIEDVTDQVNAATKDKSGAEAVAARRKVTAEIEQKGKEKTGLLCQVVTLYQGGRYHLYCFKSYKDIRLVFAPEQQAAFYGGDNDNFEYPRYDLDCCFFRIYENDKPLKPEHYLKWSAKGCADGDLTFVPGHPGRTQRLYTVDHLKFLRDVELPSVLQRLWRREVQLEGFRNRSDENMRIGTGDFLGVQNSRKAFTGVLAGLHDPKIIEAKATAERELREKVKRDPNLKWSYDPWEKIADAEQAYRKFFPRYSALEGRRSVLGSTLYRFAKTIVRLVEEKGKPSGERLKEYRDSEMDSLLLALYSPEPIYDDLEIDGLTSGLSYLGESFGGDDPIVTSALRGKSPTARADELIRGTKLRDIAVRRKLVEGGTAAVASSNDPMIRLAAALDPEVRKLRKRYEDEVEGVERDAYALIAAAKFAAYGEDLYPDATFTLRLAFGPVKGYQENGKTVPPFTTIAGLYDLSARRHNQPPFNLPQRWIERKSKLDLEVPFNFVCTADIIGGNSGSPVINKTGEVIGLVFDGNLQGLVWDIAFTEEQGRCVAVDARSIIEALKKVYDAEPLAKEMLGA